mgnify:CR=1 FL=1
MGCGTATVDHVGYAKNWFLWVYDNQLVPAIRKGADPIRLLEGMMRNDPGLKPNVGHWSAVLKEQRSGDQRAIEVARKLDAMV